MYKVSHNIFVIKDLSEFELECNFAFDIIKYADKLYQSEKVKWFFKECHVDWNRNIHFAIFRSYIGDEYKDYILSLKVVRNSDGKYDISIQKKVP